MNRKRITIEEKRKIIVEITEAIKISLEALLPICKRNDISYATLSRWRVRDDLKVALEDEMEALDAAIVNRAMEYALEAKKILDDCEIYYETRGMIKDSTAAVNKAKFRYEAYMRFAAALCPEMWSDAFREIRALQKEISELAKKIEAQK